MLLDHAPGRGGGQAGREDGGLYVGEGGRGGQPEGLRHGRDDVLPQRLGLRLGGLQRRREGVLEHRGIAKQGRCQALGGGGVGFRRHFRGVCPAQNVNQRPRRPAGGIVFPHRDVVPVLNPVRQPGFEHLFDSPPGSRRGFVDGVGELFHPHGLRQLLRHPCLHVVGEPGLDVAEGLVACLEHVSHRHVGVPHRGGEGGGKGGERDFTLLENRLDPLQVLRHPFEGQEAGRRQSLPVLALQQVGVGFLGERGERLVDPGGAFGR